MESAIIVPALVRPLGDEEVADELLDGAK